MKGTKNKKKFKKLYRRGGRIKYFNVGGMYSGNTIPGSMMPNTNTATYEQVDQARIDQANRAIQTIEANPWQQRFAQEQQIRDQQNAAMNQTATMGLGMLTDRLDKGKSVFGRNAQQLAESQGFADKMVDGKTVTAADQASAQMGNIAGAGMAADLVGQGVGMIADDQDATTMNVGETAGSVLSGAGKGASMGATIGSIVPGVGTAIGAGVGATVGAVTSALKGKKARDKAREMEEQQQRQLDAAAQQRFAGTMQGKEYSGSDMGQLRAGGRPGLWANIHAKRKRIAAGSGEKMRKPGSKGAPTDAALKRSQNKDGGYRNFYMEGGLLKYANGGGRGNNQSNPSIMSIADANYINALTGAKEGDQAFQTATNILPNVIDNTATSNIPNLNLPTQTSSPSKADFKDMIINAPENKRQADMNTKLDEVLQARQTKPKESVGALDTIQLGLAGLGMVPVAGVVPDLINAGISTARGNYADAGINLGAAIPGIGLAAGPVAIGSKTTKLLKDVKNVKNAAQVPKVKFADKANKYDQKYFAQYREREGGVRKFIGGGYDFATTPDGKKVEIEKSDLTGREQLDNLQLGLTGAGITPVFGGFADAANTLISGARTIYEGVTGNWDEAKKQAVNTGVNALTIVPFLGQGVGSGKLINASAKQMKNLKDADNVVDFSKAAAVNVIDPIKKTAEGNVKYATKTGAKTYKGDKIVNTLNQPTPVYDQRLVTEAGPAGVDPSGQMNLQYKHGGVKQLDGGIAKRIPGSDAVEFIGQKHEQGGIKLDPYTEVEDKETMDKVQGNDYFFSSYLKLGGKSFAARHKQILAAGGKQKDIEELAAIQEKVSGRDKYDLGGERRMYQTGGRYIKFEDGNTVYYEDTNGKIVAFNDEAAYMAHRASKNLPQDFSGLEEQTADSRTTAFDTAKQKTLDLKMEGKDYLGKLQAKYQQEFQTTPIPDKQGFKKNYALYGVDEKFIEEIKNRGSSIGAGADGKIGTEDDVTEYNTDEGLAMWGDNWLSGIDPKILEKAGITNISQLLGKENKSNVEKLQTAWNEAQTDPNKRIKVDGYFGEQTRSIYQQPTITLDKIEAKPFEVDSPGMDDLIKQEIPPNVGDDPGDEKEKLRKEKGKGVNWLDAATVLGGLAQLYPAYMAAKQKPDFMDAPGRIPTTHLDRVRFNAEREQNEGNYRGMSRFIETSGAGPAGIAAKMAAWGKKQTQDQAIGSQEAKQNAAIQAQEAQINQDSAKANIKNAMYQDEYNAAQRTAAKNRKVMAAQNATQTIAGLIGDVRQYQATDRLARATAGPTGVLDRFKKQELYEKRTNNSPFTTDGQYTDEYLSWESETYGNVNDQNQNESRYGGRRSYFKKGGKLKKMC